MTAPYVCSSCAVAAAGVSRCAACRAARAASKRRTRAAKTEAGLCAECPRKAIDGQTRCRRHQKENARRSAASHAQTAPAKRLTRADLERMATRIEQSRALGIVAEVQERVRSDRPRMSHRLVDDIFKMLFALIGDS